MTAFIAKLAQQPPTFWVSIAALGLAILSLIQSRRALRFSRRLNAEEKRTEALKTLIEARFSASQARVHLMSVRSILGTERPEAIDGLAHQIAEAEHLEAQLDADFDATMSAPADVLSMERLRQRALLDLASVRKVLDAIPLLDRIVSNSRQER